MMELRLGTMGPLTCAALALDQFALRNDLQTCKNLYPTFEDVRAALLAREIDVALVPHCHPVSTEMLFNPLFHFDMASAFDRPNPELYLASRPEEVRPLSELMVCAGLPIVWPLVATDPRAAHAGLRLLPVPSNPAAAQAVVEGRADLAITNAPSLEALGLKPVHILKHVLLRWFPVRLAAVSTQPPCDSHAA